MASLMSLAVQEQGGAEAAVSEQEQNDDGWSGEASR